MVEGAGPRRAGRGARQAGHMRTGHGVHDAGIEASYAALDNRCPHQGGPLGEGSIENGMLRCPWHGWDFDPTDRASLRAATTTACQPSRRACAPTASTSASPRRTAHPRTVSDVMVETLVDWGVRHVFGMVGHSNLGLADALRRQEAAGQLRYYGIRHEGAASFACSRLRQADRPTRGVLLHRGARRDQSAHRAVGRQRRPRTGAGAHRAGRHAGARPRRVPGSRPGGGLRQGRAVVSQPVLHHQPASPSWSTWPARAPSSNRGVSHLDLPRRGAEAPRRGRGATGYAPKGGSTARAPSRRRPSRWTRRCAGSRRAPNAR